MKPRADLMLIAGLFLSLVLFVSFGPRMRPNTPVGQDGSSRSQQATGLYILYSWLREIGYDAQRLEYREYVLTPEDDALIIVNPSTSIENDETTTILDWVEQGGVLILASSQPNVFSDFNGVLEELKIQRVAPPDPIVDKDIPLLQPLLTDPSVTALPSDASLVFQIDRADYVALAGTNEAPVMLGIQYGQGYMYLSTSAHGLTNAGLKEAGSPAWISNMLRRVPVGGRILFDEYHHGHYVPPSTSGTSVVLGTPIGWAITYSVITMVLFLLLRGRRFGRPVLTTEETYQRNSSEYIESMADMLLRAGKRGYVQQHYYHQFKRALARPAGINPLLPDQEFVRELARFRTIDEQQMLTTLATLRTAQSTEPAMVRAIEQAYELRTQYER